MRLKIGEIVSLATFALGCLAYMKVKKKYIAFLLWGVCLISLIVALSGSDSENQTSDTRAVTATASGTGTTAQAAGHDINNGVPASTLQQVLNLKDVELSERMLADYPHGCVILGLENGKVIYDTRLKDLKITVDWDNTKYAFDERTHFMVVVFHQFEIDYPNGSRFELHDCSFVFHYAESGAFKSPFFGGMGEFYCEVLDAKRGILLIGFK